MTGLDSMHRLAGLILLIGGIGIVSISHPPRPAPAGAEWELLPNSPDQSASRFEDLFFLNENLGWVVNGDGGLDRTLDGGDTWERTVEGEPAFFRSIGFANPQRGWIGTLTPGSVLFETTDGGQTITNITDRISGPPVQGVCGLWVIDEDVVYGVGLFAGAARVVKTVDGGDSWTSTDLSALAGGLIDLYFTDEQNGLIVGTTGPALNTGFTLVLATSDGGATWTEHYRGSEPGEWAWKVDFPSPDVGYISVEKVDGPTSKILKTTDGGQTWQPRTIAGTSPFQGVGFITPDLGWLSGHGLSLATDDGGATWAPIALDTRINRFRVLDENLAFAAGQRVYRYRTGAVGGPPAAARPDPIRLLPAYPNPVRDAATISFELEEGGEVQLAVYDMLGRRVALLAEGAFPAGAHRVVWDRGSLPAGIYVCRLVVGDQRRASEIVLVR
jgi:photosystem II stability/assembly factor-like uncharacterized protein